MDGLFRPLFLPLLRTIMRRVTTLLLLVLPLAGCCRPLHFAIDGPLVHEIPHSIHTRLTQEMAPVNNQGPVVEQMVNGCPGKAGPRIAVLDVDGILLNSDLTGISSVGENPVSLFRERLDAIAANPNVRAVVVRINSPGGGVTASDIMWRDLSVFRDKTHLPVVACLMDLGAGGAYYLSTAADVIVAHPTTVAGGIGVILNLYNLEDAMAYFNVRGQSIKSGMNIDMGTSAKPLNPEARKLLQTMADEFQQRFQQVVLQRRPAVDRADASTFDGRVFTAAEALQRHLIDRIGYLDDAIAMARELGHAECATVVLYHRCDDPARTAYAMTPNVPLQGANFPVPFSVPGLDRARLPSFLYMWQPEATLERMGGK
jgi:protease IV